MAHMLAGFHRGSSTLYLTYWMSSLIKIKTFHDIALARDLGSRSRGGYNLRSTPTIKVPRTRAVPKNVVPVYPGLTSSGIDRSTIGLEYNWQQAGRRDEHTTLYATSMRSRFNFLAFLIRPLRV